MPSAAGADVGDDAADPAQWPTGEGTDPDVRATAHTIRFSGPDRYQTNLAATLALRGLGDYPFDTPDRTSGGASGLAQATDWWGAGTCPYSVLVVAGDTFADALTAASLSDPTNRSNEPRVQRVAAGDPLFDPLGGFDRVDTDGAPIIVTRSGRSGAKSLSPSARLALSDMATGGCRTARNAIIVGGEAAVPSSVASEIIGLGYDEVFRVAGTDRYETAARVAVSLGTEAASSTTCTDPSSDSSTRMGFYGNAAVEYRPDASSCRVLSRSVVLADGSTGADALAAGWWTSFWQVPVLLTAPDGTLPEPTRTALQTLDVDTVIVLGGTGRIPEATVNEAGALAGATVGRIAGADRYGTSVEMARVFGGWYPASTGVGAEASMVCVAASSGSGDRAVGWADALAAGPWCGRAGGAAADPGPPDRVLPPVEGEASELNATGESRPRRDAVPILLVPVRASAAPASVASFLESSFDPDAPWCAGIGGADCLDPGFAIVFGGAAAVLEPAEQQIARLVSGGRYVSPEDLLPTTGTPFHTRLDMAPVFSSGTTTGLDHVCYPGGGLASVRWLAAWADADRRTLLASSDLAGRPTTSRCIELDAGPVLFADGVSLSGRVASGRLFDLTQARVTLTRAFIGAAEGTGEGAFRADDPPPSDLRLVIGNRSGVVDAATLDLDLDSSVSPARYTATIDLTTELGPVTGASAGEAVLVDGIWRLRGRVVVGSPGGPEGAEGGFRADLDLSVEGAETIRWNLDGLVLPD